MSNNTAGSGGSGGSGAKRAKLKKHACSLDLGSESMLPKVAGSNDICRSLKKSTLISTNHPMTIQHFISHTSVLAERQRQILKGGTCVIHPYSSFSLVWRTIMVFVNIISLILQPFRFAYYPDEWANVQIADYILQSMNALTMIDVVIRFNTGFSEGHASNIVMTRKRIVKRYLSRWFLIDLMSSLPIIFIIAWCKAHRRFILFGMILKMLRILRIHTVMEDLNIMMKAITKSYIWQRCVRHIVFFVTTMHWCSCVIYFPVIVHYYWYGEFDNSYCKFLGSRPTNFIMNYSVDSRYMKAMFISYSAFFGSGYSRIKAKHWDEVLISAFVILFASIFMIYTLAFFLKIYMTKYSSTMRYQELVNQVEKYMQHKQFPKQLKTRIRDFYDYRYQGRYFKEESALQCLSEQLRNEINLYTCHKLIEGVPLFEGLPANVVGTVLGCVKPEVFMTNDLILRAGDIGDCMFFISSGTVAVYSMKGAEVCHLGDGSHFGEVALLMKDRKRVATVVAVEITRVYRLDAADFRDFVMTYQELYERIEALASKRMHETVLIDEAFRKINMTSDSIGALPNINEGQSTPDALHPHPSSTLVHLAAG